MHHFVPVVSPGVHQLSPRNYRIPRLTRSYIPFLPTRQDPLKSLLPQQCIQPKPIDTRLLHPSRDDLPRETAGYERSLSEYRGWSSDSWTWVTWSWRGCGRYGGW